MENKNGHFFIETIKIQCKYCLFFCYKRKGWRVFYYDKFKL